jgi:GDP-mannose 6-dehydrogenase
LVELAERLVGKGCRLRIYDQDVSLAILRGGNKAYIEQRLPHIADLLLEDLDKVVQEAEILIVGARHPEFAAALKRHGRGKAVLDLVRLFEGDLPPLGSYSGIAW